MPTSYKVLGQVAPAAMTNTTLYTVPSATEAVVSTITVCNRGVSTTYRIAVRPNGATLANEHYIVFDALLEAGATVILTLALTIDAADVITVYAGHANTTINAYGREIA